MHGIHDLFIGMNFVQTFLSSAREAARQIFNAIMLQRMLPDILRAITSFPYDSTSSVTVDVSFLGDFTVRFEAFLFPDNLSTLVEVSLLLGDFSLMTGSLAI